MAKYEQLSTPERPNVHHYEDLLADFSHASAAFGTRAQHNEGEVDFWERSPAGEVVAFTTIEHPEEAPQNPMSVYACLAIANPSRTLRLLSAVRLDFMGEEALEKITGIDFVIRDPEYAELSHAQPAEIIVTFGELGEKAFDTSYQVIAELCERTGVYEQTPRRNRMQRAGLLGGAAIARIRSLFNK